MHIKPISALKDNYIWTIIDENTQQVIVVDPGDAKPVLNFLNEQGLNLRAILLTHHHWDHSNGVNELINTYPAPVYGSKKDNIASVTHFVNENDVIEFDDMGLSFKVLDIPAHTLGHVAYYGSSLLFSGDTLFSAGCGRVFEGTYEMMYESLQKMADLPDKTLVYCGHEYTVSNLKFAKVVEPSNKNIDIHLKKSIELREKGLPTLPSTIKDEKSFNPFLRCDSPEIIQTVSNHVKQQITDPVEIFTILRKMKDSFVA